MLFLTSCVETQGFPFSLSRKNNQLLENLNERKLKFRECEEVSHEKCRN